MSLIGLTDQGDLPEETVEKIVAFLYSKSGRYAPLTASDEAMVRRMIATNPSVRVLVDDLRATNAALNTLLDAVASSHLA